MTTTTDRVSAIFADARAVHADALRLLEAGDIRDAAEKAWCATKRATDALILARTGVEPEFSSDTTRGLGQDGRGRQPSTVWSAAITLKTGTPAWNAVFI